MAMTGAHRIPIYSPCADPASPSALNGVCHTDDHRAIGHEAVDHNAQQSSGNSTRAPAGAVEDLVIACKVSGLSPAGHTQAGRDGPFARCQHSTHRQNKHMLPAGCRETRAPRVQPLAQYQGNGVADIGLVWVQHPMLRIPADAGCNAEAVAMRRAESDTL